jgi:hypothetical protein
MGVVFHSLSFTERHKVRWNARFEVTLSPRFQCLRLFHTVFAGFVFIFTSHGVTPFHRSSCHIVRIRCSVAYFVFADLSQLNHVSVLLMYS